MENLTRGLGKAREILLSDASHQVKIVKRKRSFQVVLHAWNCSRRTQELCAM